MSFENYFPHEEDFADFCVRFMNALYECNSFQKFGKREKQDGIDIIDMSHGSAAKGGKFLAVQCKNHEPHITCEPGEISAEVKKAAKSGFRIDEYYILTSGRKTVFADKEVLELNGTKPHGQTFLTYVWAWPEIRTKLEEFDAFTYERVLNAGKSRSNENLKAISSEISRSLAPNTLESQTPELQARFTKVEAHLKENSKELAKYELEQIDAIPVAMQHAKDRYLVHRLNAKYLMLMGDYEQAAQRFLKAYAEQSDLDQAMINRAVAFELLGRKDEAWKQAEQLLKRGIRTEPLPAIAYRTAPKPHSESTIAYYSDQLSTSEELSLVIADEARDEGRFEDSIAACDRVLQINASSARACLLRAFANHSLAVQGDCKLRRARLELAERDYQSARDNESDRLPDNLRADLFRNLGNVQFLLDLPGHASSFEEAIRVARDKFPYVEQYLGYLCARTEFETAGKVLQQYGIDDTKRNQRFLKLVIEKNLSEASSCENFVADMLALYQEGEFDRRDECLGFVVQWSIDSGRAQEAIARLNAIADIIDPFEFHCCMAWLEHIEEDVVKAKKSASDAKSLMTPDSPQNYVYLLGRVFVELGDDESALPVLEQAADWSRLTQETRSLLDCAQRLQKHDVMLEVCRTLRKNKSDTKQSRSLELQILYGYVPKEAQTLIHELVQEHPNDRQIYAWLCYIETRLHGKFAALDVTKLPLASETSVFDSQRVLGPLLGACKFGEAISYTYENLRCNQGDEIAHGRYMWIFMQYAGMSDLSLDHTEVAAECAVLYREKDGELKSVIITNDLNGSRFDGEISPDSELGKELIHKKLGDEVILSPLSLQPRVVKVEAILSKFVYRYQQVLQNFQVNFPHANTIQMLKVMDGDELDVSLFKKSLEERRKHIDTILDLFKQNPLPISAFATWLGIEYRDAFEFLSTKPDIGIRCSQMELNGSSRETPKVFDLNSKSLVLDQSAVLTIENLDLWKHLGSVQLVIMRSVTDLFESHIEELEHDRSKGTMGLSDDGQLFLHEPSDEERQSWVSRAQALMKNIRKHCRIEESLAAASVDGELRSSFDDVHAYSSLDSIAYTHSDPKLLLWTDEMIMQAVARNDFKFESIGVQDILNCLRAKGAISHYELDTFTAKILGSHYNPVEWNSDVAFAAAKLSKWDADCQPFKEVLRQFSGNHWKLRNKCQMALELFVKVYRSNANDFSETHLLLRVMDAIGERKAADLIRSDAFVACMPNQAMLDSISLSLDIWQERWFGK
jgi:tetratricopeptide (TPR) repeat protein